MEQARNLILNQISQEPNFSQKIFHFWHNLTILGQKCFSQKSNYVAKKFICQPKFGKKLMIQFQETAWIDRANGRAERWMKGQTYRLYFIGPFQLLSGVQLCFSKITVGLSINLDSIFFALASELLTETA